MSDQDRILFVDDEAFILFSLRRYFKQHGVVVDVETDCIKAVELIRENKYKVIISDFRMPNMNGADFLGIVKEISPDSVRIMLSAHVNQETLAEVVNKGEVYRFVSKPWNDQNLLSIIQESLDKFNGSAVINPSSLNTSHQKLSEITPEVMNNEIDLSDVYIDNILPKIEVENTDLKKYSDLLRNEIHQHLNYIISLTSSRIGLHCKRVAQLSLHFAKKLKWEEKQLKDVYYAALYHDIGKLFELVAQADHSELGSNLLGQFQEMKDAAKIVRGHHKRLDDPSSGEIEIGSRLLAIVDHFDKEVTKEFDREVDEKPRTLVDIIGEMEKEINLRFDNDLMIAFKEMILEEFKLDSFFNEEKIHITELREGMVLSRPLLNVNGKMLLNSEYLINKEVISRLFRHNKITPLTDVIYIYKKPPEKSFNYEEQVAKKVSKEAI